MAISVLTNVPSLFAQKNLAKTQSSLQSSIGKLSSGLRINNAADDAAGLGISENLKSDIRSLAQAQRNANDGISLTQVAEGGMNEMQGLVTRMRELAVQSANQTLGSTERGYIQTEFGQLRNEVNRISAVTEFNGQKLLDGSASAGLSFQVGMQNTANDRLSMSVTKLTASTLGSTSLHVASATLSTVTGARNALGVFDKAIEQLSTARSKVGAVQNRMQVTISNLSTAHENLSAANSRIRDVDVASETANLTKSQILSQAGLAVLAQANQLPSAALSLLG
ncbi:MAG: flagellin FliC [Kofleriaceae bacterium]|jgi:flagellin|nr:flagellin FliC [Kofleriaceae bacterium]MBP6841733.1 flagellin FliC [Kofleriaceae bacterium]MBP9204765.1 flagellin FliC [Kofleriaceae bacterium]